MYGILKTGDWIWKRSIYHSLYRVSVYRKCKPVLPPSLPASCSRLCTPLISLVTPAIRFYVFYFLHIFYTSFKLVLFWKVVNGLGFFPTLNNKRRSHYGGGEGRVGEEEPLIVSSNEKRHRGGWSKFFNCNLHPFLF